MVIPEDADTIMPALPVAEKKLPGRERKTTCHRVKTWFLAPQLSAAALRGQAVIFSSRA